MPYYIVTTVGDKIKEGGSPVTPYHNVEKNRKRFNVYADNKDSAIIKAWNKWDNIEKEYFLNFDDFKYHTTVKEV